MNNVQYAGMILAAVVGGVLVAEWALWVLPRLVRSGGKTPAAG